MNDEARMEAINRVSAELRQARYFSRHLGHLYLAAVPLHTSFSMFFSEATKDEKQLLA